MDSGCWLIGRLVGRERRSPSPRAWVGVSAAVAPQIANTGPAHLAPASPRRPGAICSRTDDVPGPYRKRADLLSCRRSDVSEQTISPGRATRVEGLIIRWSRVRVPPAPRKRLCFKITFAESATERADLDFRSLHAREVSNTSSACSCGRDLVSTECHWVLRRREQWTGTWARGRSDWRKRRRRPGSGTRVRQARWLHRAAGSWRGRAGCDRG